MERTLKHLKECNPNAEVLLRSYPNHIDHAIMDLNLDEDKSNNWVLIEFEEQDNG